MSAVKNRHSSFQWRTVWRGDTQKVFTTRVNLHNTQGGLFKTGEKNAAKLAEYF